METAGSEEKSRVREGIESYLRFLSNCEKRKEGGQDELTPDIA